MATTSIDRTGPGRKPAAPDPQPGPTNRPPNRPPARPAIGPLPRPLPLLYPLTPARRQWTPPTPGDRLRNGIPAGHDPWDCGDNPCRHCVADGLADRRSGL